MSIVTKPRIVHAVAQAVDYLYGVNSKNQTVAVPFLNASGGNFHVYSYGAIDGAADNTTALQAALDAACEANGTLLIPPGTWWATHLTISDNVRIIGTEPLNTVIKQIASSNRNFITIAYTVVGNPIIENVTIDGNRTNNTSSGHGLYLEDHAETDATVTYGFSVVLRNSYVQNVRQDCLYVGVNRNMGHSENCELKRGGRCLYVASASDWRFFHTRFAFPLTTHAIEIVTGADNVFVGGSAYGATLAACVRIKTQSVSPTKLIGMTINSNSFEGLHISGPSGVARGIPHVIQGCFFGENSLDADNTYSHIKLTDIANVSMVGNVFRYTGSGNRAKYLVEFTGVTGDQEWTGNSWNTVTTPFGTDITNTAYRLYTKTQGLKVGGPVLFADLTYLPNCADDTAAASAGVNLYGVYRTGSAMKVRVA